MNYRGIAFGAAIAFGGIACGGEELGVGLGESDDEGVAIEEALDEKSDAYTAVVGTWQSQVADAGGFARLVLLKNKWYHAESNVYCVRAPCPPPWEEGKFKLTKRGSKRYITLSPALSGSSLKKYEYKAAGSALKLRKTYTRTWQKLVRGYAWCGDVSDCSQQPWKHIMCAGYATCNQNSCGWSCGMLPGGAEGDTCGGFRGPTCAGDLYCGYPVSASCGWADQTGTCAEKPSFCTREYRPVCGCNGHTYDNSCAAAMAGQSVLSVGICQTY